MQFSARTIALLLSALSIASAAPAPDLSDADAGAVDPESRDIIILGHAGYAWQHVNQKGDRWGLVTIGDCRGLWGLSQNDKISSIQIDEGIECKFYRNIFCDKNMLFGQGGELKRTGPYTGNIPSSWNDEISGYRCYKH